MGPYQSQPILLDKFPSHFSAKVTQTKILRTLCVCVLGAFKHVLYFKRVFVFWRTEVLYFILLACFGPLWAANSRVSLSCLPLEQTCDGSVQGDWSSVLHEPRCRNRVRHFHGSHWKGQEFEHDKNVNLQFLCKLDVLVFIVALEPDSTWYRNRAMRTLCQVTSRKKRVFSSNLQTFITAAWQLISVRKYLRYFVHLTQKYWQHGTLMSGKSVECNCGQLDPHGIGIQCSRDLVERQENPGEPRTEDHAVF